MNGTRKRVKIADLRLQPIRQSPGSPEELKALGSSWLDCPVHDIIVTPSLLVADGNRRVHGLLCLGETEVNVFMSDEELDEKGLLQIALTTAIHRADLSGWDKFCACQRLQSLNPAMQLKDLAAILHLDPSSLTRLLSPSKTTPEWQEALKAGKVGVSDCYAASKLPADKQVGLLTLKLSGATRDQLESEVRKKRIKASTTVRATKIKVPLVGGSTVTVAGEDLSLEEAIEAMAEAVKLAKAGLAKGLSAKTAQSVWRDVAAASMESAPGTNGPL